jgi:hypothetical protein
MVTSNFAARALGIPTRRVGIPDFVVKNEGARRPIQRNVIA